jgi:hypothetical protein
VADGHPSVERPAVPIDLAGYSENNVADVRREIVTINVTVKLRTQILLTFSVILSTLSLKGVSWCLNLLSIY